MSTPSIQIRLTPQSIRSGLTNIGKGVAQYLWLQAELRKRDVSKDTEFQRRFNSFYRVMRRTPTWYRVYYQLLESSKTKQTVPFAVALTRLYKLTHRVEASFASKLVATVDPSQPVIDRFVYANIGLRLPGYHRRKRLEEICEQYEHLRAESARFLKTSTGKYLVQQFRKQYPDANISHVKMLDFVLWQTR